MAGVFAQQSTRFTLAKNNPGAYTGKQPANAATNFLNSQNAGPANRGNGATFASENFGSGTRTSLPTGWTTSNTTSSPVKWHWTNTAATGAFSIAALNSTTAANGWMIFDSDSAGAQTGYTPPLRAYLVSPSYNCTGHANVQLSFEQYFRKFQDSCAVDVSNDGGITWKHYPISANSALASTSYLPTNPYTSRINISAAAGNKPNVKIRFDYVTSSVDGSYNWMVDDLALSDMDAVDVGIHNSAMLFLSPEPTFTDLGVFSQMPATLVDSLFPFTFLTNYGVNNQTNLPVNVNIYRGGTSVYNTSITYPSLPATAEDSFVQQTATAPAYLPLTIGSYNAVFSINPAGDTHPADNVDTFSFATTDTVFSTSRTTITGFQYIHRPSTASGGEKYFYYGSRFDIPVGKSDTATSVSISFNSRTIPGAVVKAQIYKLDLTGSTWVLVNETFTKTLTAADISTPTNAVLTGISIDAPRTSPAILNEGLYAVVVQAINVKDTATVAVNTTTTLFESPGLVGYLGQSSDASADGVTPFADGVSLATGLSSPARITLNFGRYKSLGISNTPGSTTVSQIYPNPANTTVSVRLTTKSTAKASLFISNAIGQILATQQTEALPAGNAATATFNTAALANGIYFLTIAAGEDRIVRKFVVAH